MSAPAPAPKLLRLADAEDLRAFLRALPLRTHLTPALVEAVDRLEGLVLHLDCALATVSHDVPKPLEHLASYSALVRSHEVLQSARAAVREARTEIE